MDRRLFLRAGLGVAGVAALPARLAAQSAPLFDPVAPIVPIRATPDRLFRVTVCLRPLRAAGPRIEVERVGAKRVVHHYGHGGSGWSLSWGSAEVAVPLALADGVREVAVVGAGAIGLTTAITAQRMGAKVTIYARERFPDVRSARATGAWTPDSRVARTAGVDAGFAARWEAMARRSFAIHNGYLGLPGEPVEWTERYLLRDEPPVPPGVHERAEAGFVAYADRIVDITPRSQPLPPGSHPFPVPFVSRNSQMTFNVADYAHQLEADFLAAGGRFVPAAFRAPSDLTRLRERAILNCTGYGARALFADESVVPVRGQIAWLIPQAGVHYGLYYRGMGVIARRDGIVVQDFGPDDEWGVGDANETPDYPAAHEAVQRLAGLYAGPAA